MAPRPLAVHATAPLREKVHPDENLGRHPRYGMARHGQVPPGTTWHGSFCLIPHAETVAGHDLIPDVGVEEVSREDDLGGPLLRCPQKLSGFKGGLAGPSSRVSPKSSRVLPTAFI